MMGPHRKLREDTHAGKFHVLLAESEITVLVALVQQKLPTQRSKENSRKPSLEYYEWIA